MKKEEFTYKSKDNVTDIHAVRYVPDFPPRIVFQIAHGMCEYIERYDTFSRFLCSNGILVTGNDHLGHGASVTSKDKWGYFAKKDGYNKVVEDMHELTKITKSLYPNCKYVLLGHSMGSFFTRYYLTKYSNDLDGAVIMGTGYQNKTALFFGRFLICFIRLFKGWNHRSKLINNIAIGSYNKNWEPSKTHMEWLTKDTNIVNSYISDPACTFNFTLNAYYNMFKCMSKIISIKHLKNIKSNLPLLLLSGTDDPVGNFGVGVEKVYKSFINSGHNNIDIKMYENDRHELLNEIDRNVVFNDILKWLSRLL